MFRRLTTLVVVLAFGLGMVLPASAAQNPMTPERVAAERVAVAPGMDTAGGCSECDGGPGMSQRCLPSCVGVPVLIAPAAMRLLMRDGPFAPAAVRSFAGAESRPDPYPPRPTILG